MAQTVLIRQPGGTWRQPKVTAYAKESELQAMLHETPELILDLPLATVREFFVPGVGPVDLLGIAEDGTIVIVECKLSSNPEIRREVIGQIFAYTSGIWQLSIEGFAAAWASRAKKDLDVHLAETFGDGMDVSAVREQIDRNLRAGVFTLVVAVDEITAELKRIIEYVNVMSRGDSRMVGLELQVAKEGSTEILIPHSWGMSETTEQNSTTQFKWNPARFNEEIAKLSDPVRSVVQNLMKHGEENASHPFWGVGRSPGMSWYYEVGTAKLSLFQIYLASPTVRIAVGFGAVASVKDVSGQPALAIEMLERLRSIPELLPSLAHIDSTNLNKYPGIPVAGVLDQDGVLAKFLDVVDWVRKQPSQ